MSGIMRLPQIAETGSTTDMDESMQQVVAFENFMDPCVLREPELLKLATHKHMVEYVSIRQLEEPTFRFGCEGKGHDVLLFTNFCNNYDVLKKALKERQPDVWEKHVQFMGPGKVVNIPCQPEPVPSATPEPEDFPPGLEQELGSILAQEEVRELASRGGWSTATLTATVMQVLKRADTVDMPGQHAPGTVANARKSSDAAMAAHIREQTSMGQDQKGTCGKEPAPQSTSMDQDQQGTCGKEAAPQSTSMDQDQQGTGGKEPAPQSTSKDQDQAKCKKEPGQQSTSTDQDQEGTRKKEPSPLKLKQQPEHLPQKPNPNNPPENPGPQGEEDSDVTKFKARRAGYMRFYRSLDSPLPLNSKYIH